MIWRGTGAEDRLLRARLLKAATAPRGMQWVCDACGHVHAEWRLVCADCSSLDRLGWREVAQSYAALSGPIRMLPLIVGGLDDKAGLPAHDVELPAPDTGARIRN